MELISNDTIYFSQDDLNHYREIADGREGAKHPDASNNKFTSRYSSVGAHYIGVLGEAAFAAWAGDRVDERFYRAGDAGFDAEYRSMRVDVKTRKGKYKDLAVDVDFRDMKADIAVLVWLDGSLATLVGWADRQDILSKGKRMEFIKGHPRLVVSWENLSPLWLL